MVPQNGSPALGTSQEMILQPAITIGVKNDKQVDSILWKDWTKNENYPIAALGYTFEVTPYAIVVAKVARALKLIFDPSVYETKNFISTENWKWMSWVSLKVHF